jgi:uncharacterized ferredoxin-like protein
MQMSKRFVVKGIEHIYDEKDKIFFMREATTERHQQLTCLSCDAKFTDRKQISHCEFCGHPSCPDCIKKTRCFYVEKGQQVAPKKEKSFFDKLMDDDSKPRGRIC